MTTPLVNLKDLALQPRKGSHFRLMRISRFKDNTFHAKNFKKYSQLLTEHLVRSFRVTKTANKDATLGVFRPLKGAEYSDVEEELGLCCVLDCRVPPDHAKVDPQLGPRPYICDVVLCIGRTGPDDQFGFAYALTRGRTAVIETVLTFLRIQFGADTEPATVAPHHLTFLAREWTRDLDDADDVSENPAPRAGRKLRRLNQLEMCFSVPPAVQEASVGQPLQVTGDVQTIQIQVENESLKLLHDAVENSNPDASSSSKDPALVAALTGHLKRHLNVDLNGAALTMISTPTAELASDGQVRFLWPSHLKRALLQLAEVAKAKAEQQEL